jgi:hypothetical protein
MFLMEIWTLLYLIMLVKNGFRYLIGNSLKNLICSTFRNGRMAKKCMGFQNNMKI